MGNAGTKAETVKGSEPDALCALCVNKCTMLCSTRNGWKTEIELRRIRAIALVKMTKNMIDVVHREDSTFVATTHGIRTYFASHIFCNARFFYA